MSHVLQDLSTSFHKSMSSGFFHVMVSAPCMGAFGGLESFVLTIGQGVARLAGFSVEVIFKQAGNFALRQDLMQKI